jgi:phage gp46-like protein
MTGGISVSVDIKLFLNPDGQTYGIRLGDSGDLTGTEGLDTSIYTTLLTDSRASESEVSKSSERNGWIGNLANSDGFELGSLLWIVNQKRRTLGNLAIAIDIVEKALEWYLDGGLLLKIEVSGELESSGALITINMTTLSGVIDTRYVPLWKETV